jgi:UPF0755 protein
MRRWLLAGAALALVGASLVYGGLFAYQAEGPLARPVDFVVPRGGLEEVAVTLRDAGVVASAWQLRAFGALTNWQGAARAGEFSFPARASLERVLLILRHGRPVQHLVTVPEGSCSARIGQILASIPGLFGDVSLPEEGDFLPESYAFQRGIRVEAILRRARVAMMATLDRAWANRLPDLPLRNRRDLLVLASLVERETHVASERALVAAVFFNRLRLGMRLQSDPTVVYAASGGVGELQHGLRRDELALESPYNTYLVAGLPAGPICNPGAASIEAASRPGQSDALYFVADGTGGHVFARSLEAHSRNVSRYRSLPR